MVESPARGMFCIFKTVKMESFFSVLLHSLLLILIFNVVNISVLVIISCAFLVAALLDVHDCWKKQMRHIFITKGLCA